MSSSMIQFENQVMGFKPDSPAAKTNLKVDGVLPSGLPSKVLSQIIYIHAEKKID